MSKRLKNIINENDFSKSYSLEEAVEMAIKTATAATFHAISLKPAGAGEINIIRNSKIPIEKPFFLYADII